MASMLTTAGWVVYQEAAATSDPATWPSYSFIISSSGANTGPVAGAPYRAALEAYVAAGGKLLLEGGEVAYDAISSPGYPTFKTERRARLRPGTPTVPAPLVVRAGMATHPIMSRRSRSPRRWPSATPATATRMRTRQRPTPTS